jgi:hypothetical protein
MEDVLQKAEAVWMTVSAGKWELRIWLRCSNQQSLGFRMMDGLEGF